MTTIDLNADLGEGFGPWTMGDDAAMMDIVTSANIACGGHAGDMDTMFTAIRQAMAKGVSIGAHPGFADKAGFGRRKIALTSAEIERLIAGQVGTLKGIAALAGGAISYVKAHGALANWAAVDADIAGAIANAIVTASPDCAILAISGTELEKAGRRAGLRTYAEVFADRAYTDAGTLAPRGTEGAVLTDADAACDRLVQFLDSGRMPTISGGTVALKVDSICIHGDNPHAVAMARTIRTRLLDNGVTFRAFSED